MPERSSYYDQYLEAAAGMSERRNGGKYNQIVG
jgi:hypothetical protein